MDGVKIVDPATTFISPDAVIGKGTTIQPFVVIGERVVIGENCEIGPFTHIRPDVNLGNGVKAGAFVELKNSTLGDGSAAGHLVYVGDSDVGKNVNFGCGTVTVNHDGVRKHRTVVGDGAFIGCNTNLIAPVTVGAGAYTAAGSTITHDVPPGALAIARERQTNKEDWKRPAGG
jgi:bifunctional UDP-N-acetylglucosamine pyrophosphorylase/glucosamine-1-phosphate N-acetyltransferase